MLIQLELQSYKIMDTKDKKYLWLLICQRAPLKIFLKQIKGNLALAQYFKSVSKLSIGYRPFIGKVLFIETSKLIILWLEKVIRKILFTLQTLDQPKDTKTLNQETIFLLNKVNPSLVLPDMLVSLLIWAISKEEKMIYSHWGSYFFIF